MICPRCAFPDNTNDHCRLCGLTGFAAHEEARYREEPDRRTFNISIIFPDRPETRPIKQHIASRFSYAESNTPDPMIYVFFNDAESPMVNEVVDGLKNVKDWMMFINGRRRPYSKELWLPMLQMLL